MTICSLFAFFVHFVTCKATFWQVSGREKKREEVIVKSEERRTKTEKRRVKSENMWRDGESSTRKVEIYICFPLQPFAIAIHFLKYFK